MICEDKNRDLFSNRTLRIDEEKIVCLSEYKETSTKWKAVNKIDFSNKHIFIYESAISAVIIPLSAFNSKGEEEKFIEKIKSYYKKENEK